MSEALEGVLRKAELFDELLGIVKRCDYLLDAIADEGYLNESRRRLWVDINATLKKAAALSLDKRGEG